MKQTDIIFIRVKDNRNKLRLLTEAIQRHFLLHHKLLVAVTDAMTANYVDELLWRLPEESFFPHRVVNGRCTELIAITMSEENVNGATVLFNLLSTPHKRYTEFDTLYELYDETDPIKAELSQRRLEAYPRSRFL
jgi:DNA polymerase-3 subunit chi